MRKVIVEDGISVEIHVADLTVADKVARVVCLVGIIVVALDVLIWRT